MTTAGATGHSVPGQRTFDCPWCGAISRIPADHLGEHFACPECHKSTKLTEANTSTLSPTSAPPDAPHLVGDRTFDCPWCGAISAIPSSHLGEHFACPECHRQTKLTETNTTRRPPTEPPPDAPHVESVGAGRGVLVGLVLVLVGAGVWLFLSNREPESPSEPDRPAPSVATSERPTDPAPAPLPPIGPAEPTVVPASGREPPASASSEEVRRAETRLADAKAQVALAETRLSEVRGRLAPFSGPEADVARQSLVALREISAESAPRLEKLGPEPGVDDVRGYNFEVVRILDASPRRARVAETALAWLRGDPLGGRRDVAGLSWREMNFHGPGFRRALAALEAKWSESGKPIPENLRTEEAAAVAALAAAKGEQAAAETALAAARAPR
jgi:hypothetical protein